jgi:hypothetical protein
MSGEKINWKSTKDSQIISTTAYGMIISGSKSDLSPSLNITALSKLFFTE